MSSEECLATLFSANAAERVSFWLIIGWIAVGLVGLCFFVNGLYMLISPRAWFRLPGWLRASGSLRREEYSSGLGAVQVRITGALFAVLPAWLVLDSTVTLPARLSAAWDANSPIVLRVLTGLAVLLVLINGVFMLASPRTWLRLPGWLGDKAGMTKEAHSSGWGAVQVRVYGAAFVAFSVWAVYALFFSGRY